MLVSLYVLHAREVFFKLLYGRGHCLILVFGHLDAQELFDVLLRQSCDHIDRGHLILLFDKSFTCARLRLVKGFLAISIGIGLGRLLLAKAAGFTGFFCKDLLFEFISRKKHVGLIQHFGHLGKTKHIIDD